jgi:catechol 2,3-dioxygenase-like lactoylglutathione lyase family enzyme
MEMKLEVVAVPVSDVDRAIDFYANKLGFHLDGDWKMDGGTRYVQVTPVGSACSIVFGNNITKSQPGSLEFILLVVEDIHKVHDELVKKDVKVTDVEKMPWGSWHIYLSDPDGNKLTIQQKPPTPEK